jgi:diaminopimelate decarboxylase
LDHFDRRDGSLFAEDVALARIASEVGTPTYVYSRATIERHYRVFDDAWSGQDHLVCYAVKASSNLAILSLLAKMGSGFDIVSIGELERVLRAGGDPGKVVFSGVGKRPDEVRRALEVGILSLNIESAAELEMVAEVAAEMGVRAPVSMRINPDVDAGTHPYISTGLSSDKFGIPWDEAIGAYERASASPSIEVMGLDCHIGSQLADAAPVVAALDRLLELVDLLSERGITIRHLDVGGGLGITYEDETPPTPASYAQSLRQRLVGRDLTVVLEPGRVILGNAGILLTRVELAKKNGDKRFIVVDAAMNDLLRPTLYGAYHRIIPVGPPSAESEVVDVVGPVCESGDFLARDRELPHMVAGDLLAVRSAGAYGFAMSSNYNSRPRAAEVLVDGDVAHVIRSRESLEDLWRGECIPED